MGASATKSWLNSAICHIPALQQGIELCWIRGLLRTLANAELVDQAANNASCEQSDVGRIGHISVNVVWRFYSNWVWRHSDLDSLHFAKRGLNEQKRN
jgi:hypothetical protein